MKKLPFFITGTGEVVLYAKVEVVLDNEESLYEFHNRQQRKSE